MMNERLRWLAVGLLLVVGVIDLYYGNSFAGFYENLWYVMGGVYIFAAIVIAMRLPTLTKRSKRSWPSIWLFYFAAHEPLLSSSQPSSLGSTPPLS